MLFIHLAFLEYGFFVETLNDIIFQYMKNLEDKLQEYNRENDRLKHENAQLRHQVGLLQTEVCYISGLRFTLLLFVGSHLDFTLLSP